MSKLLTQNRKMAKSSTDKYVVYNWTLPAFVSKTGLKTCPSAGSCAKACYAKQGAYIWSNVSAAHERNLAFSLTTDFEPAMVAEIAAKLKLAMRKGKVLVIRIHDAGDFYSEAYLERWIRIMEQFSGYVDHVKFYAYTKQVRLFESIYFTRLIRNSFMGNGQFRVIYSEGGVFDREIPADSFHARIFGTKAALDEAGYADASNDDLVAALGDNRKIGLVYHGAKSKAITTGNKLAVNTVQKAS